MNVDKLAVSLLLLALAAPSGAEPVAQCRLPETEPDPSRVRVWHTLVIESSPWSARLDGKLLLLPEPRDRPVASMLGEARLAYDMLADLPAPLPRELKDALLSPQALQIDKVSRLRGLDIQPGKFGQGIFVEAFDSGGRKLWQGLSAGLSLFLRCDRP